MTSRKDSEEINNSKIKQFRNSIKTFLSNEYIRFGLKSLLSLSKWLIIPDILINYIDEIVLDKTDIKVQEIDEKISEIEKFVESLESLDDSEIEALQNEIREVIEELNLSKNERSQLMENITLNKENIVELQKHSVTKLTKMKKDILAIKKRQETLELYNDKLRNSLKEISQLAKLPSGIINAEQLKKLTDITLVLQKKEDSNGKFFRKKPFWIDFEQGFMVERSEVKEIINELESRSRIRITGLPASGKTVLLKNLGYCLCKRRKKVFFFDLKELKLNLIDYLKLLEESDENTYIIIDDAHLQFRNVEWFLKILNLFPLTRVIIGSRTINFRPKTDSQFEIIYNITIKTEDITDRMIKSYLKIKLGIKSNDIIQRIIQNLEKFTRDLWVLSWALIAFKKEKETVEKSEILEKIKESITAIISENEIIDGSAIFLPLSVFYRFELPIERMFLEKAFKINPEIIDKLIFLGEIQQNDYTAQISLLHSSIADLYYDTFKRYVVLRRDFTDDFEQTIIHKFLQSKFISSELKKTLSKYLLKENYEKIANELNNLSFLDIQSDYSEDFLFNRRLYRNVFENLDFKHFMDKLNSFPDPENVFRIVRDIWVADPLFADEVVKNLDLESIYLVLVDLSSALKLYSSIIHMSVCYEDISMELMKILKQLYEKSDSSSRIPIFFIVQLGNQKTKEKVLVQIADFISESMRKNPDKKRNKKDIEYYFKYYQDLAVRVSSSLKDK